MKNRGFNIFCLQPSGLLLEIHVLEAEAKVHKCCGICLLTEPLPILTQCADSRASWRLREAREPRYFFFEVHNVVMKNKDMQKQLKYQEILCLCLKKIRLVT